MKYFIALLMILSTISYVKADYIDDVRSFGYVSGEGIACGARKYPAYETIARAYLVSAAKSDDEQAKGMYEYNEAKAKSYLRKRHDGLWNCAEVNERFNNQKIFKSKLYKNGTLKMSDGKIIKPRKSYDASILYNRQDNEREQLDELYRKISDRRKKQAKKEGIYDKIRKAEEKLGR